MNNYKYRFKSPENKDHQTDKQNKHRTDLRLPNWQFVINDLAKVAGLTDLIQHDQKHL